MAPKHKLHESKPRSKCKQLASPSTAIPSPVHSQRKCKKELIFHNDDDDTPIAHLVHKSSPTLTPKTSKRHETGKYGYQINSFTLLSCSLKGVEATNSLLDRLDALASTPVAILKHPHEKTWFRKEPLALHTISTLKTETHSCPPPGQDNQFVIFATVLRVCNDTSLTYKCCPLYLTAMHEGTSYPSGCSKQNYLNKEGRSIHRYRAKIVVHENTGRATLTLFDQAAKELFNTSSNDISRFKKEDAGHSSIASILHEVMNKQFLFYIKVTLTNYHYISTMYSSGYTAELAEWIPKVYKPRSLLHPLPSPLLPSPSTSQPSHRGVRGEEEARAQVTYERRKQLANLRMKAYKVAEEKLGPHLDILDPLKY